MKFLITDIVGFIGSIFLETLLNENQTVVGLDNFSIGHQENLDEVKGLGRTGQRQRFRMIKVNIQKLKDCKHSL